MHYTEEDYSRLYNERLKREKPSHVLPYLVILILLVILGIAGAIDYADSIDADTQVKEAREAQVKMLQFPLPYTATVTQSGPGIKEAKTRYYVPKERK